MKLSVLDEILEENFTQTLEKNSPDKQKVLTDFVDEIEKFTEGFDAERRKKLDQILALHLKVFESDQTDRFKAGVRFGLLLCFEIFGMNADAEES